MLACYTIEFNVLQQIMREEGAKGKNRLRRRYHRLVEKSTPEKKNTYV